LWKAFFDLQVKGLFNMLSDETVENTGSNFNPHKFLYARKQAWAGLLNLANSISAGDTEELIKEKHLDFFPEQTKAWHPPKVRFGKDTTCSFKEKSTHLQPLEEGDLFFFDFGPVIQAHEADVGDTFRLGDPSFINPAKEVFKECEKLWLESNLSGEALYGKAQIFAEAKGLVLNPKMAGHRLSDFPHALHHKGSLASYQSNPSEMLWVLEIHLIEKNDSKGYFYEDILGS
jgi:hypothetical protein